MEQEKDPELSLLLATEAVKTMHNTNDTVLPFSNTVLRQSIIKSRIRLDLKGHAGYVLSAVYSPDGKRIATAGRDGIVRIYTIWKNYCK